MKRNEFLALSGLGITGIAFNNGLPGERLKKIIPANQTRAKITYRKVRLELFHPWTITRGTAAYKENVFVFYTKDGITGIGEAGHMTAAGQNAERTIRELQTLIPFYENEPPWYFDAFPEKAGEILPDLSPAKAAIDIALLDWVGKAVNLPVYRLFGINPEKKVFTSFSIGRDTPEVMKQKVEEAKPYKILKIKITGKEDKEAIKTIRSMTGKPIRVDVNEGWTDKEKAIRETEWLASQGVEFVEQPMPVEMLEETRWLKERSPIPIVADEAVRTSGDILKIAGAYDGINIKLMKSGGLLEAFRMTHLARLLKMDIMFGCMIESSVGIAAAVQLQSLARWIDLDGNLLIKNDPYTGLVFENGYWVGSGNTGIGIKPK